MADNHIQFRIGSSFQGEGFKKAQAALAENRKEIASSVRGLGELSTALEGINPGAAKAAGAVQKFGQAFVAGGIVGGVITLALDGLAEGVKLVVEKMKEAEEAAKRYAAALKDNLLAAIGSSTASFRSLREEMSAANREADDLLNVLNGNAAHEAANEIFKVNTEKLEALAGAMSDTEKGIVEATANYKIALIKATEKEEEAANAIDAYRTKLDSAAEVKEAASKRVSETDNALADLTEKCREYLDKRTQVENFIATEEERFKNGSIDLRTILVDRKNAELKIKDLEEAYKGDVERLKKATSDAEAAKKDAAAADRDYTSAQNALHAAVQKHEEALQDVTLAEKEGELKIKEAQDKDAKAKEELAEKEQEAADKWHEFLQGQVKKLEEATSGLADKMDETGDGLDDLLEDMGNGKDGKIGEKVKVTNPNEIGKAVGVGVNVNNLTGEIKKPRKLDDDTFERIKNGQANIADWKRFDRFTERENRDEQSSKHRIGADAVRFLANAEKPDSWLSDRDRQFQEDFKTRVLPQLPADVAAELLGEAGKKVLCKEDLKDFLGDNSAIMRCLKNLGLK